MKKCFRTIALAIGLANIIIYISIPSASIRNNNFSNKIYKPLWIDGIESQTNRY